MSVCDKKGKRRRTYRHLRCRCIDTTTRRLLGERQIIVTRNNYRQHKHQRNKNNQKTKIGSEILLWAFQAKNKRNITRKTWTWRRNRNLQRETESFLISAQKNSIRTKVRSPDGDTEYFDIVAGVLQRDTLAPYLFIICLVYVLRTSIDKIRENGFELTKKRSRRYPT